jgi:type II secretory pathway pseudopilin PulG
LIEAALLSCLLAVVLAVFVPTFLRRVRTNKISEAAELLQTMSQRTAAYYETTWPSGLRHCLPPGAGPTPAEPTMESAEVDFLAPDAEGHASWEALGFQPERPIRYSYRYAPTRDGCGLDGAQPPVEILFQARGDLDGDEVYSTYERRATLGDDGFVPAEALLVQHRTE